MDTRELAWAAGLFEGEGCFGSNPLGYPRAAINMTDEDSLRRFCAAVGVGNVTGPHPKGDYKPQWTWQTQGLENVQVVAARLWYGLGQRRRSRAKEVLAAAPPLTSWASRTHCSQGHLYDEENTLQRSDGGRRCRICKRESYRRAA